MTVFRYVAGAVLLALFGWGVFFMATGNTKPYFGGTVGGSKSITLAPSSFASTVPVSSPVSSPWAGWWLNDGSTFTSMHLVQNGNSVTGDGYTCTPGGFSNGVTFSVKGSVSGYTGSLMLNGVLVTASTDWHEPNSNTPEMKMEGLTSTTWLGKSTSAAVDSAYANSGGC